MTLFSQNRKEQEEEKGEGVVRSKCRPTGGSGPGWILNVPLTKVDRVDVAQALRIPGSQTLDMLLELKFLTLLGQFFPLWVCSFKGPSEPKKGLPAAGCLLLRSRERWGDPSVCPPRTEVPCLCYLLQHPSFPSLHSSPLHQMSQTSFQIKKLIPTRLLPLSLRQKKYFHFTL